MVSFFEGETRLGNLTVESLGSAVAADNNLIVAGAPWLSTMAQSDGGVYVYTDYGEVTKLSIPSEDARQFLQLGQSVGIYGNTIVAGADNAAYVFTMHDSTSQEWELVDVLSVQGSSAYGAAVAIHGDVIVVGDHEWESNQGAVYVYLKRDMEWYLNESYVGESSFDFFGYSVAAYENRVVVGARNADDQQGAVYLFPENRKLVPSHRETSSDVHFGWSVAVRGDVVVVGSRGDDDGAPEGGAVYVFNVTNDTIIDKYLGSSYRAWLGTSVAIGPVEGGEFLVAASGSDEALIYKDGLLLKTVTPSSDSFAVAVSSGGEEIVYVGDDGVVSHFEPMATPIYLPPTSKKKSSSSTNATTLILSIVAVFVAILAITLCGVKSRYRRMEKTKNRARSLQKTGITIIDTLLVAGETVPLVGAVCAAAKCVLQQVVDAQEANEMTVKASERVVGILEFLQIISDNTKNLKQNDDTQRLVEKYMRKLREKIEAFSALFEKYEKRGGCCGRNFFMFGHSEEVAKLDADIRECLENLRLAYQLANDRKVHALLNMSLRQENSTRETNHVDLADVQVQEKSFRTGEC